MTNLVILVGRIARDPESRTTQGGTTVTSISVVTDRPARKDGKTYKDENGYTAIRRAWEAGRHRGGEQRQFQRVWMIDEAQHFSGSRMNGTYKEHCCRDSSTDAISPCGKPAAAVALAAP